MSTSKASTRPKVSEMPWKTFGEYLDARLRSRGMTQRQLAMDLEVDPSHLTRLIKGKVTPSIATCRKVAEYFGDPTILTLRLAGWIDARDVDMKEFLHEMVVAFTNDPDLQLLYQTYLEQGTPEARRAFVRSIRAAFGQKGR
jgi:transcriptional regulator with XRE-family HTH domain